MHISQIRPNHRVRLCKLNILLRNRTRVRSALFQTRTNAPDYFLPRLVQLAVHERNLRGRDLEKRSRESSAPSLLGRPPVARSPQGEKLRGFYSPISHELVSRTSCKSCCLNRSARAPHLMSPDIFSTLLDHARPLHVVN